MELLFVACLVGEPERCEEKSLQFVDPISHTACMRGAQPQLALWVNEHPKWRIAEWTCRTAGDRKIPI